MKGDRAKASESGSAAVRFLLRLPSSLHAVLLERARARDLSLNEYVVRRLSTPDPGLVADGLAPLILARAHEVAGTHVMGVILHGSWSRGEARPGSDVDVLIVVDESVPLTRALYRAWDRQPISWENRPVDAHFIHVPRPLDRASGVWCEAAVEGRLLFDRRGGVEEALIAIRRAIAGGRLVRKHAHGQPYWTVAA